MNLRVLFVVNSCFFIWFWSLTTCAQDSPKIGYSVPDYQFKNVHDYTERTISISQFHGKWLILDFWTAGVYGAHKEFFEDKWISEEVC